MSGISDSQDGTKIEKYQCYYCYRVFQIILGGWNTNLMDITH